MKVLFSVSRCENVRLHSRGKKNSICFFFSFKGHKQKALNLRIIMVLWIVGLGLADEKDITLR